MSEPRMRLEFDWPCNGFAWNDELRALCPVMRGLRVEPFSVSVARLFEPPQFGDGFLIRVDDGWNELVKAGADLDGPPWDAAAADEATQPERLREPEIAAWRQLFYQSAAHARYGEHKHHLWAVETAIALHGLPFALETQLSCGPSVASRITRFDVDNSVFCYLRTGLAALPEPEHAICVDIAHRFREQSQMLDCVISYLFPERQDWAEPCVTYELPDDWRWWLDDSAMSLATACRHFSRPIYGAYGVASAVLHVYLHGEAAMPLLLRLIDNVKGKGSIPEILRIVERMETPELIPGLVSRLGKSGVSASLLRLAERWPVAVLGTAIGQAARARTIACWASRMAVNLPDALPIALDGCTASERAYFLAYHVPQEEAESSRIPAILRTPPWLDSRKSQAQPALVLSTPVIPDALDWPDGILGMAQARARDNVASLAAVDEKAILEKLSISTDALHRLLSGEISPVLDDAMERRASVKILFGLPENVALALWNSLDPKCWIEWQSEYDLRALLCRLGPHALPGLLKLVTARSEVGWAVALPCRSMSLVPLAASALRNTKKARPHVVKWLHRHVACAVATLLPLALGKPREGKADAGFCLRWMSRNGHDAIIRAYAAEVGPEAAAATDVLLAAESGLSVPKQLAELPAFFVPEAFRRPVLKRGGALPLNGIRYIANMLTIGSLDAPYDGLEIVKDACTPDSLAEFAWDTFEAWLDAGMPQKEKWAFHALGVLGDDQTARRIAAKIDEWPIESARATTGLDVLASIGSDSALIFLSHISAKVKYKTLREKARERISRVAEARALTLEELSDRLVPDFGLDRSGLLKLDFGPRAFYVSFDETLKPYVRDATGAHLKDLPKPNRNDDPVLAERSTERYKVLKKDAKAAAGTQIARLEHAMCSRRRWTGDEFQRLFVTHPFILHLAKRLVWATFSDTQAENLFRIAEDGSLADRFDERYSLPDDAFVGIVHTLEIPPVHAANFANILADYEIRQPFPQLGRKTFTLNDDERRSGVITRFLGKEVSSGAILGLASRGWNLPPGYGGHIDRYRKRLPGELIAELEFQPGWITGDPHSEPRQTISAVEIGFPDSSNGRFDLASLDAIVVSEIIRDVDMLAPYAAP